MTTMHLEKDAERTWCPWVRESDENMGSFNRWNLMIRKDDKPTDTEKLNPGCCCIASRCAMWEWHPDVKFFPSPNKLLMSNNGMPDGDPVGYCGLKKG